MTLPIAQDAPELPLTFAELEFLLQDEPAWPRVRAALNGQAPQTPQVIEAGAASLLARNLARIGPGGKVLVSDEVSVLSHSLVAAPCLISVCMMLPDALAVALYCAEPANGIRVLVPIETPGIATFRRLPADEPTVQQAMTLVDKAAAVSGAIVMVKALGQAGVVFRRQGDAWQLADSAHDPHDLDRLFRASTQQACLNAARDYLARNLAALNQSA